MEITPHLITLTNHDGGGFGLILDNLIGYSVRQWHHKTGDDEYFCIFIDTRYLDNVIALSNSHTVSTEKELRDNLKIINNALANALQNTLKKLAANSITNAPKTMQ